MQEDLNLDFDIAESGMETLTGMDAGRRLTWKGVDPASVAKRIVCELDKHADSVGSPLVV